MQTLNSLTKKQDLRNNIYHQNCMPSFLRPHPYYHSISNNILFVAQECWVIQNDHAWLYFNPTGVFALFVNQFDYSAPDHLSTKWAFFSSNNNRLCLLTFYAWSWSSADQMLIIALKQEFAVLKLLSAGKTSSERLPPTSRTGGRMCCTNFPFKENVERM